MIRPLLADQLLLDDIRAASAQRDRFSVWWLGQSGFLVQWQGRHLLLDPYLSDSLTVKYASTDKPHVRMTERVIRPERLDFIDGVTSTHNHTDHLDAETLCPLLEVNPSLTVMVPSANRAFAASRLQVPESRLVGLDVGDQHEVAGFSLEPVPAAHEKLDRDELGRYLYVGYLVRFGPWTLYHSGDTILYDGMAERLQEAKVDLALLPINGRAPERRVSGNLWGREAAWLAHEIGAAQVIPCHYEMFEFNTATPDEFEEACRQLGQRYTVLQCGQRWTSD